MEVIEYSIKYVHTNLRDLSAENKALIDKAKMATVNAYAPYSNFKVGASLLLDDGTMLSGSNKENVAFPAGVCAERNVLNYASDHYPGVKAKTIAITASTEFDASIGPVAPCGICRQVMCEVENTQSSAIEVLLVSPNGEVLVFEAAKDLLPFHFHIPQLKK